MQISRNEKFILRNDACRMIIFICKTFKKKDLGNWFNDIQKRRNYIRLFRSSMHQQPLTQRLTRACWFIAPKRRWKRCMPIIPRVTAAWRNVWAYVNARWNREPLPRGFLSSVPVIEKENGVTSFASSCSNIDLLESRVFTSVDGSAN